MVQVPDRLLTVIAAGGAVVAGYMAASASAGAVLLAAAVVGLVALLVLALAARRWPAVVLAPLGITVALTPKTGPEPLASVAGMSVLPTDAVLAVAATATLLGAGRVGRRLSGQRLAAGAVTVLVVVQLVLGLGLFGTAAVLDARVYLLLIALTGYLLSLEEIPRLAVRRWLYITCSALVLVAVFRGMTEGWGTADELVLTNDGALITTRVIVASQAALITAGMVTAWHDWAAGRGLHYGLLGFGFAMTVALAQHRSVWVAGLVGLLVVMVRVPKRSLVKHAGVVLWLLMLTSPALVNSPISADFTGLVRASAESSSLTSGTGGDRVEGARQLIHEGSHSGPARLLLGEPFGGGYDRTVMGRLVDYHPHNAYVQTFIRLGLVGVIAATWLLLAVGWTAVRGRTVDPATAGWVAVFAVFSLAYAFPFELAPLLALALTSVSESSSTDVAHRRWRKARLAPLTSSSVRAPAYTISR